MSWLNKFAALFIDQCPDEKILAMTKLSNPLHRTPSKAGGYSQYSDDRDDRQIF